MKSVDVPVTSGVMAAILIGAGAFVMAPILVICGLFWFYDVLQSHAEERIMQRHQATWDPRKIPQCDRELWERITDGCSEEKSND